MRADFYAKHFDAESQHWWFRGRAHILLSVLARCLADEPAGTRRILDVGCGTGAMTARLSRFGTTEGIDADPQAIEFCRRRNLHSVKQVSDLPLPYEKGSFDVATAFDVLEHIDDDWAMLCEIRRVLRPGGTLLVSVPAYQFLWGRQDVVSRHCRRYTAKEVRQRLVLAGFEVQRLSYFNTVLFPVVAAVRLLRRLHGTASEPKSDFEVALPRPLNGLLARLFAMEAGALAHFDFPFGVSVMALALNSGAVATAR